MTHTRPTNTEYHAAKAIIAAADKITTDTLRDSPALNKAFLVVQEWTYGYREQADTFRGLLTREQRRVGIRFPYQDASGKRHEAGSNRSAWLCWLCKRSQNHSLPRLVAMRLAAEYHGLALDTYAQAIDTVR